MNANRLINTAIRILMNKVLSKGINRMFAGRKGDGSPEQQQANQKQARQAKQTMRAARRIGRF